MSCFFWLALVVGIVGSIEPTCAQDKPTPDVLRDVLASRSNPWLTRPDFSAQADALARLYSGHNNALIWLGDNARGNVESALNALDHAKDEGLNPADYDNVKLRQDIQTLIKQASPSKTDWVWADTAVSTALLRLVNDIHSGRVDLRALNYPARFGKANNLDAAELLSTALQQGKLNELALRAEPKNRQYQRLKNALAAYRKLPDESHLPHLVFDKPLHPGDTHPRLIDLYQRLKHNNALDAVTTDVQPGQTYDPPLVEAVKRFQEKSGLEADGIVGGETTRLLNQSVAEKIEHIELAMERARWLPDDLSGPLIMVNIPAFELRAFDAANDNETLSMRVIVGKAVENQTPVLFEDMKYVEFMPYWNIPHSIMSKELLPKLSDDLGFFANQDIEIVNLRDDDEGPSIDTIFDDLRQGRLRARQRPGSRNPLGKVKFVFPNKEDVYLHDTPIHALFKRNRRDFSHGCVRVAEADKLAEFVLSRQTGWDKDAIQQAMSGGKTQRVSLQQSIPVMFIYTTSYVDSNNTVHFYKDVYGYDDVLKKALESSRASQTRSILTSHETSPG